MASLEQLWARIHRWFELNVTEEFRERVESWRPPATAEQIAICEKEIGTKLPDTVRESYLLFNGDNEFLRTFSYGGLYTVEEIAKAWRQRLPMVSPNYDSDPSMVKCDRAIRRKLWDAKWIPITDSGSGDHFCIDLSPAKFGVEGQIIRYDHERGPRDVIAASFAELLATVANRLEGGEYRWSDKNEQIMPIVGSPGNSI